MKTFLVCSAMQISLLRFVDADRYAQVALVWFVAPKVSIVASAVAFSGVSTLALSNFDDLRWGALRWYDLTDVVQPPQDQRDRLVDMWRARERCVFLLRQPVLEASEVERLHLIPSGP